MVILFSFGTWRGTPTHRWNGNSPGLLLRCIHWSPCYHQLQVHIRRNTNTQSSRHSLTHTVHKQPAATWAPPPLYWSEYWLLFFIAVLFRTGMYIWLPGLLLLPNTHNSRALKNMNNHLKFLDDLWWHYRVTIIQTGRREDESKEATAKTFSSVRHMQNEYTQLNPGE